MANDFRALLLGTLAFSSPVVVEQSLTRSTLRSEIALPNMRRIIFHIGLEKTGTSSVQASLHRNDAILRRHSILYPKRNAAYGWENHKPLVGCYGIDEIGDRWLAVDASRRPTMVSSLIAEIESAREWTAVISAEHFSSRFRLKQIEELRRDFARFDCRVVIVLRDHLSRLCSAYESYVTNGGALPLSEFAEGMMRSDALDLRYADLIAQWVRVFGRDCVELIAYNRDVIPRVMASICPELANEPRLCAYRIRVSAKPNVVAALRLANLAVARSMAEAPAKAAWARGARLRLQLKMWLLRCGSDQPASLWCLDEARLARIREMATLDAARLAAENGFVLEVVEDMLMSEDSNDAEAGELLARALLTQAAKPWTKASLTGAGFAVAVTLLDWIARLRADGTSAARSAPEPRH